MSIQVASNYDFYLKKAYLLKILQSICRPILLFIRTYILKIRLFSMT